MNSAPHNREIGPIGVAGRIAAGLGLIVLPIATHGIGLWDVVGGLVLFPLLATALGLLVTAAYEPMFRTSAGAWFINLTILILVLVIAIAATYVTPIDAGAIWLFFGLSLLVAAVRGDAGCEVLAFANASSGQRDKTGCIAFAPLDSLEARLAPNLGFSSRRHSRGRDSHA